MYLVPADLVVHPVVGGKGYGQQGGGHDGRYGGQREGDRGTRHFGRRACERLLIDPENGLGGTLYWCGEKNGDDGGD